MFRLSLIALILVSVFPTYSQSNVSDQTGTGTTVEILNSDVLKLQEVDGQSLRMLVGNVRLKQKNMLMYCDSAILNRDLNSVDAFGSVHINQNDSIKIYSDILKYDGNTQVAALYDDARLTNAQIEISSDELFYNLSKRMAYYHNSAVIRDNPTVLSSKRGYYYANSEDVYFKDSVVIVDPNYKLTSDTLKYNTITKIAVFYGKTEIENEGSKIICYNGWYDTQRDLASFGENTVVENPPQRIMADSLYYRRDIGYGKALKAFTWIDEELDMIMKGTRAEFFEAENFIEAVDRPLLIYLMEDDSLFLSADTLKSKHIEEEDLRFFYAYYDVRMYHKDMQSVCDSLYFSFQDSSFQLFYDPILWTGNTQMTADTIVLTVSDKSIDKIFLNNSAFIISPAEGDLYDQVKGKNVIGYFKDNKVNKMNVIGNAESLYFGKDEDERFIGMNKSLSSEIWMYFKESAVSRIKFLNKPEAKFTPMRQVKKESTILKDFELKEELKPDSQKNLQ